jgi:hypothetical protein
LLGDFNVKIEKEDNFKPIIGKERIYEIINDNVDSVVNFATLVICQSAPVPECKIH